MTVSGNSHSQISGYNTQPFLSAILARNVALIHTLIDAGISPNAILIIGEDPQPALFLAVTLGDRAIIDALLSRGAHVNASLENGVTVLMGAVIRACHVNSFENATRLNIIDILLNHGVNVNAIDVNGNNALNYALKSPTVIGKLAAKGIHANPLLVHQVFADIGEGTPEEREVLHRVVGALLTCQIDVNSQYREDHFTLLHVAVTTDNVDSQIITMILKKNANANARDIHGQTALEMAIMRGNLNNVSTLLEHGADANIAIGPQDHTALMYAISLYAMENYLPKRATRLKIIDKLLAANVNINAIAKDGKTALFQAVYLVGCDHHIITKLIKSKANINKIYGDHLTVLNLAIKQGYLEKVATLLENGANANSIVIEGTVLMLAINTLVDVTDIQEHENRLKIIESLAASNLDINAVSNNNITALHLAALPHFDVTEAIPILAKNHANMEVRTSNGYTPLMGAIKIGNLPAVKSLVANGALVTPEAIVLARSTVKAREGEPNSLAIINVLIDRKPKKVGFFTINMGTQVAKERNPDKRSLFIRN